MLTHPCHRTIGRAMGARPSCEVADIVRRYGDAFRRAHRLPPSHHKVLRAIEACRTAALGGHRERCADCGFARYAYNSCRNRHCPKCQSLAKERWLDARRAELLPVGYFHNVFTLPHELNPLVLCHEENKRAILNLLFQAVSETLVEFGRNNLGAAPGVTMVLHTWDQQLRAHFHLHCLITGGGLALDGSRWVAAHRRYLFPVKALAKVFRGKFLDGLRRLYDAGKLVLPASAKGVSHWIRPDCFYALLAALRRKPWVVYSKAPFAGPEKLLAYLGRYTHRVALSNSRLISCDDGVVRFHYRDRAAGDVRKIAEVGAEEFLLRFLRHVLPKGLARIRHCGLLANCRKAELLAQARTRLHVSAPERSEKKTTAEWIVELLGIDVTRCPACGSGELQREELPPSRRLRRIASAPQTSARPTSDPPTRDTS